jgi:hypothetical protein
VRYSRRPGDATLSSLTSARMLSSEMRSCLPTDVSRIPQRPPKQSPNLSATPRVRIEHRPPPACLLPFELFVSYQTAGFSASQPQISRGTELRIRSPCAKPASQDKIRDGSANNWEVGRRGQNYFVVRIPCGQALAKEREGRRLASRTLKSKLSLNRPLKQPGY